MKELRGPLFKMPNICAGYLQGITFLASPNFNSRPKQEISLLVIHNISLPPGVFGDWYIERFFLNNLPVNKHTFFQEIADLKVSAHFCIRRDGTVRQFVSCLDRAWHAGLSTYRGRDRCNDFSIGIELEGTDNKPFTDEQYQSLGWLTLALKRSYPDIGNNITGHENIAPGRKTDPGKCFDWPRFNELVEKLSA